MNVGLSKGREMYPFITKYSISVFVIRGCRQDISTYFVLTDLLLSSRVRDAGIRNSPFLGTPLLTSNLRVDQYFW
jgi:hypothetical protein